MFGSRIISRGPGDFVADYEMPLPTGHLSLHRLVLSQCLCQMSFVLAAHEACDPAHVCIAQTGEPFAWRALACFAHLHCLHTT